MRSAPARKPALHSTGFQAWEEVGGFHFFALGPIVVGVAFEAAGFGVVWSGCVTGFAARKRWNEDVAGFFAGECARMAADAREASVGVVIETRVGHPSLGEIGFGNVGQRSSLHGLQRVTLFAGLAPEEFFGVGRAFEHPLCWG